jgi:hypothetical protein
MNEENIRRKRKLKKEQWLGEKHKRKNFAQRQSETISSSFVIQQERERIK